MVRVQLGPPLGVNGEKRKTKAKTNPAGPKGRAKKEGSLTTAYREEEKEYRINAVPRDGLRAN